MNATEMIEILQAHQAGKTIEGQDERGWFDMPPDPWTWKWEEIPMRVKAEPSKPREFWIWNDNHVWFVASYPTGRVSIACNPIRVREVIE